MRTSILIAAYTATRISEKKPAPQPGPRLAGWLPVRCPRRAGRRWHVRNGRRLPF